MEKMPFLYFVPVLVIRKVLLRSLSEYEGIPESRKKDSKDIKVCVTSSSSFNLSYSPLSTPLELHSQHHILGSNSEIHL